jgi:phosphoglycolate phosphatase
VLALPGVVDVLARLESAGVRQTVVTGNIEVVALLKLHAAHLVPPIDSTLGGYGDSGTTRVEVANSALDRLSLAGWSRSLDTCWIVGDTPRDLQCARALGVRCALVATGRHSLSSMADLGADLLLPSLADGDRLFERWMVMDGA